MSNLYRNQKWIAFRKELIELDGKRCVRCGRTELDGIRLQVHHKLYEPGKPPWEYAYKDCETLCQGCHAREHGHIRPDTGWDLVGEEDLGDILGECEVCGTSIRYVFEVHHPDWEPISVGTDCCDKLTETHIATEKMKSHRRHEDRQARFIDSPRWKQDGSIHRIEQKGIVVRVVPFGAKFKIKMNEYLGKSEYLSLEAAKMKAFEIIENGKAAEYIRTHRRMPNHGLQRIGGNVPASR